MRAFASRRHGQGCCSPALDPARQAREARHQAMMQNLPLDGFARERGTSGIFGSGGQCNTVLVVSHRVRGPRGAPFVAEPSPEGEGTRRWAL
jgi:hypothetical protein